MQSWPHRCGRRRGALAQDAHLDVLVLGVDRTQVGYSYIGGGAVLMQVAMDRAEADATRLEAAANARLGASQRLCAGRSRRPWHSWAA